MSPNAEALSWQLEDYLETIYHLQSKNRVARAKDIAERLRVTRATVTSAFKNLSEKGLLDYEPYSFVTLTPRGEAIAQEIIRRHRALEEFFTDFLQMKPDHAEANACRVEHAIDSAAVDRLEAFLEFVKQRLGGPKWADAFEDFCEHTPGGENCANCDRNCLAHFGGSGKK